MVLSEIFTPDSRGHCFTFWYHMYGHNVGTLKLYVNNRYRSITMTFYVYIHASQFMGTLSFPGPFITAGISLARWRGWSQDIRATSGGEATSMCHTKSLSGYQKLSYRIHRINVNYFNHYHFNHFHCLLLSPQFIFEFIKGAGPNGSIAIDDIHIIPGPCDSDPTSSLPHSVDSKRYINACHSYMHLTNRTFCYTCQKRTKNLSFFFFFTGQERAFHT